MAFEYQKDEELWNFLRDLLAELNIKYKRASFVLQKMPFCTNSFFRDKQLEFLNILGYAPNLEECVFCAKPDLIAYNVQARGAVCKSCFLNGQEGIVVKNNDFLSESVLGSIFESLAEKKISSLNFLNFVLKL